MIKPNQTIVKETRYILLFTILLSVIMQIIFLVTKNWDYTVLLGNLWGGTLSVLNFFFMGLYIQKAVSETEEEARKTIKTSYTMRTMLLFLLVAIGVIVPFTSTIALIISLFFSRVAIFFKAFGTQQKKEAIADDE